MAQLAFDLSNWGALVQEAPKTTAEATPIPAPEGAAFNSVFLLGDEETIHLSVGDGGQVDADAVEQVLRDYLDYLEGTDEYRRLPASALFVVGVSSPQAAMPPYAVGGVTVSLRPLDMEDEEDARAIRTGNLFLAFPNEDGGVELHPVRSTGKRSLLDAFGLACLATLTVGETRKFSGLPLDTIAEWCNTASQHAKGNVCVLVRNGAAIGRPGSVGYVGSENYAPLSPKEGLETLLGVLREEHQDIAFKEAMISWEYLLARYEIQDDLLVLLMEEALGQYDTVSGLACGVIYQTSEVGLCAMTARAYISYVSKKAGRRIRLPLPYPVKVEHQGKATVAKEWREGLADFAGLFKDSLEGIERMGQTCVPKLGAALLDVRAHYPSELPKAAAETAAALLDAENPEGGTAVDVYLAAAGIVDPESAESAAGYVDAHEFLAHLIGAPWEKIAKGEEWKRRKA